MEEIKQIEEYAQRKEAELERKYKSIVENIDENTKKIDGLNVTKNIRSFTIEIPVSVGVSYITFSEVFRSKQTFETMINIQLKHITDGNIGSFEQRINLNSASAVSNLATSLNSAFGGKKDNINWTLILNRAGAIIKKIITESKKPEKFDENNQQYKASSFLFYPFLEQGNSNMIHGDGGTGKSYFCLYMAICAIINQKFFDYEVKPFKTLYLDWEDTKDNFENRIHRIVNGLTEFGENITYQQVREQIDYYKPESSIMDEEESISKFVETEKYDLIILDAGGDASGGSPLDEEVVLKMFSSVDRIPCTKLIIHHEPKNTDGVSSDKAYYGTTYWRNKNRIVWRLKTESVDEQGCKTIKAEHTKANNSKACPSFFFKLQWEDGLKPLVRLWKTDNTMNDELVDNKAKIVSILNDLPITEGMIQSATNVARTTLKRLLIELYNEGKINRDESGRAWLYTLKKGTPNYF